MPCKQQKRQMKKSNCFSIFKRKHCLLGRNSVRDVVFSGEQQSSVFHSSKEKAEKRNSTRTVHVCAFVCVFVCVCVYTWHELHISCFCSWSKMAYRQLFACAAAHVLQSRPAFLCFNGSFLCLGECGPERPSSPNVFISIVITVQWGRNHS